MNRHARDVVVLSMGANDATALCAPSQWAQWQHRPAGQRKPLN